MADSADREGCADSLCNPCCKELEKLGVSFEERKGKFQNPKSIELCMWFRTNIVQEIPSPLTQRKNVLCFT